MPKPFSKSSPPSQKRLRGTQTDVTAASVNTSSERFDNEDENDYDYDYDDNFLEDESQAYCRENVGPVASPYLLPYV